MTKHRLGQRKSTIAGLLLAGIALGAGTYAARPAIAAAKVDTRAAKSAAVAATRAMGEQDWSAAVRSAEKAVAASPQDAGYRSLLGQAYLRAGRFDSAAQALSDALSLQPVNARVALNLALAQIGAGKWDAARSTLAAHAKSIAPVDRGLALALAGDPKAGVEVLTAAARAPEADAKTRQNLALAMALAGRWKEARALVAVDMSADLADARIIEWAGFARPQSASQQVATLLGITPVTDPGQPIALALNAAPQANAPVDADVPAEQASVAPQPVATPTYQDVAVAAVPASVGPRVVFGPRQEVVQPLPTARRTPVRVARAVRAWGPAPLIAAAAGGYKTRIAATAVATPVPSKPATKGDWSVQIGAYDNAAIARADWARASKRLPALAAHTPTGAEARVKGASVYRMAVAGLARADADALCRDYRAKGGDCFVRAGGAAVAAVAPKAAVAAVRKPAKAIAVAKVIKPAPVKTAAKPVTKPTAKQVEVAAR